MNPSIFELVGTSRDGDYWLVFTQYDPKVEIYSSMVGKEPEILQLMAESFRVSGVAGQSSSESLSVEDLRALQQADPAAYTAQMERWGAEVSMIGEQFVSASG